MTEPSCSKRKIENTKIVEVNCPSPLDLKSNGVVKVIAVGKKGFRIGRIDPMSTRLEGVALLSAYIAYQAYVVAQNV